MKTKPIGVADALAVPVESRPTDALGIRVLLAEDDEVNQTVAAAVLTTLGCRVEVAADGERAVERAGAEDFDLILMDCQMPVMDGFEASRRIRGREAALGIPRERGVPIIALTANAMQGDRERCLDAGMDDYLPKPFTRHELGDLIRRQLRRQSEAA
jgi:CheY-like chemotaxis protein